jgi:hypothetical protein
MRSRRLVATLATFLTLAAASPALAANALSFPPTSFTILNPDTGVAVGRSVYLVESTQDGAILHGQNHYFDDQSDVETSRLRETADELPRLVEFDHTFYNADGSILLRVHLDLTTGAATCIDNSGGQQNTQGAVVNVPDNTWAGASIVLPIQNFLRAGSKGASQSLHVFTCAPGPKIFSISVQVDPGNAVWTPYRAEALRVEVRPDFGWLNVFAAAFVPRLHAWFDPSDGWAFVGDEAARYFNGPRIMLVKTHERDSRGAARLSK